MTPYLGSLGYEHGGCCGSGDGDAGLVVGSLQLVGKVGVLVEQLADVEHDGLGIVAGVGEDQLESLAGGARLRSLLTGSEKIDNVENSTLQSRQERKEKKRVDNM